MRTMSGNCKVDRIAPPDCCAYMVIIALPADSANSGIFSTTSFAMGVWGASLDGELPGILPSGQ
jgi:hypothetical protein